MTKYNVYGWKKQEVDVRDYSIKNPEVQRFFKPVSPLPSKIDLRGIHMPPIYDQGSLGSCTANAAAAIMDYGIHKAHNLFLTPSRLFQYYNTRMIEGTVDEDSGASIRNSIRAIAKYGAIPEDHRPYDIKKFAERPAPAEYTLGEKYQAIKYVLIDQPRLNKKDVLKSVKSQLAQGYPLDFGTPVFEQIEHVGLDGQIALPSMYDEPIGGHAMVIVGYDDTHKNGGDRGALLIRNSWGVDWGMAGYGWLPYGYVLARDLVSDIWCLVSQEWESHQ